MTIQGQEIMTDNHMADRIEDKAQKIEQAFHLLLEARDALPAISMTSARLHGVNLTLADRIENWLAPWRTSDDDPEGI